MLRMSGSEEYRHPDSEPLSGGPCSAISATSCGLLLGDEYCRTGDAVEPSLMREIIGAAGRLVDRD